MSIEQERVGMKDDARLKLITYPTPLERQLNAENARLRGLLLEGLQITYADWDCRCPDDWRIEVEDALRARPTERGDVVTLLEYRRISKFCAEEVTRQGDSAIAVWWMTDAWLVAEAQHRKNRKLNAQMIQHWGHLIQPEANPHDLEWRRYNVVVGDHRAPEHWHLKGLMDRYVERFPDMTADEAYLEFEKIHPLGDGNGRTGKLLYNWKLGGDAMRDPKMPPDFFGGIANP